jgi:hypothetical protein
MSQIVNIPDSGGIIVQDEGALIASGVKTLNFAGTGVTATSSGDGATITVSGGGHGHANIAVQDEGTQITPAVSQFNFTGTGVTATASGANVTVNVPPTAWSDVSGKPSTFPPDTHTHTATNIIDFNEAAQDAIASTLVAGTNINIMYNDPSNTITIASTVEAGAIVTNTAPVSTTNANAVGASAEAARADHTHRLNVTTANMSPIIGDFYRATDTLRYRDSNNAERTVLDSASNLSGLASTTTARTNLGLGGLAVKTTIATADIDNTAVTYAKIQNVSANNRLLGRNTAGAGSTEEVTPDQTITIINTATSSRLNHARIANVNVGALLGNATTGAAAPGNVLIHNNQTIATLANTSMSDATAGTGLSGTTALQAIQNYFRVTNDLGGSIDSGTNQIVTTGRLVGQTIILDMRASAAGVTFTFPNAMPTENLASATALRVVPITNAANTRTKITLLWDGTRFNVNFADYRTT